MAWLRTYGNYLYWGILVVHLAFIGHAPVWAAPLTKLALMPILLGLLYAHTQGLPPQRERRWIFAAYAAAYLGDALLIGEGLLFFLGGMLSFMLTHVLYSLFFLRLHPLKGLPSRPMVLTLLLLGSCAFSLYAFLSTYIASAVLQTGILVYMCLIVFMAGLAAHLGSHPGFKSLAVSFFLPGALAFVVSDALLATNLFYVKDPLWSKAVMLTYGFAQWRLLQGFVVFFHQKKG